MKDDLGKRMKEQYEHRTRYFLPRRTYSIIRLDGKAFHTYTRGLQKPFDDRLSKDIDDAVKVLMSQIQGAQFAYCQSDEISILLTDFEKNNTSAWFDGNIQKITSVSSSILTAEFNKNRILRLTGSPDFRELPIDPKEGLGNVEPFYYFDPGQLQVAFTSQLAYFDARLFTIPDRVEVMNYFIWRNQDTIRNSVSMVAQSLFSHNELHGKSSKEMLGMIPKKGKAWETEDDKNKFGRIVEKYEYVAVPNVSPSTMELNKNHTYSGDCLRNAWRSVPAWKFTENPDRLDDLIPDYPNNKSRYQMAAMEDIKKEGW